MTDKDKAAPELEALDLVVRARRGSLTAHEREFLARTLGTSATTHMAHEIGSDFDRASSVRPGDEALIERALTRALDPRPSRRARRAGLGLGLLAATLVVASAAAAMRGVFPWQPGINASLPAKLPASKRELGQLRRVSRAERAKPASADETPAAAPAPVKSASVSPERTLATPGSRGSAERHPASMLSPSPTAASIFREAGVARRAGELTRARALYEELEARFPESDEASVSRVSLGNLLLGSGRAREAEAAFGIYLQSGARALREEALVGRADALLALGRLEEERGIRRELLARYPTSVYANRARERIGEIDRDAGAPRP